jgi:hypothetical protein
VIITSGFPKWRISSAAVLLALLLALTQLPALAEGGGDGCNPGRSSNYLTYYFAGADANNAAASFGGIYGTIDEYSPFVYDSSAGDTGAQWVMIDNPTDWAQVGWIEFPGNQRYVFVEFNDPGVTTWDNYFSPYAINSDIKFQVTYKPTCPSNTCFSFFADNSPTQLTGSKYNWTPTDAQSYSETHDQASQIPGGYDNVSTATNLHVYYNAGSSGSWNNMDGYDTANEGYDGGAGPSWDNVSNPGVYGNTSYSTWDSACAS